MNLSHDKIEFHFKTKNIIVQWSLIKISISKAIKIWTFEKKISYIKEQYIETGSARTHQKPRKQS